MDIRVQRTFKMLDDAFAELLEEKPFEEITVSEICERSTVRRVTFYKHFQDKYDYLRHFLGAMTERFVEQAGAAEDIEDVGPYVEHMQSALIGFLDSHDALARNVLGPGAPLSGFDAISEQMAKGIVERLERRSKLSGQPLPCPAEVSALFYVGGFMQILRWWHEAGRVISAGKLAEYVTGARDSIRFMPQ